MEYIVNGSVIQDEKKEDYEVLDSIGSGGFGIVFKIKRKSDKKIFALKTLQVGFSKKEYLDAFKHEGKVANKIKNENVVDYLFFQYEELPPYIIMELAEDGSLLDYLEKQRTKGFFENKEINNIYLQLINGMKAINKELIHRDLKPANILISNGKFKITDFGLSKISEDDTRTSTFKGSGTYSYMSPEAWRLQENTILMDIYSMGLIFYEIATLQHPFKDVTIQSYEDWRKLHLYKNPKPANEINSSLSPIIVQLIQKMISKSPAARFNNWNDLELFLKKDNLPQTKNTGIITEILSRKTEADIKISQLKLEKEAREESKKEKRELVEYMLNEKITLPLKEFIDEINSQLADGKIMFNESSLNINMRFNNGKYISISCSVIYEEDFYRETSYEWLGQRKYRNVLRLPKLRNENIVAWGIIKSSSNKGYNFLLIEKPDDSYGNWILLTNTNNALSRRNRTPEPFYFDYEELEKELPNINALHIYDMKDEPLNLEKIYNLIKEEII